MDIWDTGWSLAPGHRLRLWLSSSDVPTHEPLTEAGRNLILHDAEHPSQLILSTRGDRDPVPAPDGVLSARSTTKGKAKRCTRRSVLRVKVPRGLRHARARVAGKRVRVRRGVATVRVRGTAQTVTVRFTGTNRRGRHVTRKVRVRPCR